MSTHKNKFKDSIFMYSMTLFDVKTISWLSMALKGSILITLLVFAGTKLDPLNSVIFLVLVNILTLQGILDFGFIPSFVRVIAYMSKKENNKDKIVINNFDYSNIHINDIYEVFNWLYFRLTFIFFILFFLVSFLSLYNTISLLETETHAWAAIIINTIGGSLYFSFTRYAAILTGNNRIKSQKLIETFVNIPILIILLIAFLKNAHYLLIIFILNLGFFALYIFTKSEANKLIHKTSLNKKLNFILLKSIISSAWRSGLGVLLSMGTINGSALVIASIMPPSIASQYLIAQRLAIAIASYSYVPFQVIIPKISSLYAQKKRNLALKYASNAKAQVTLLVIFAGLFVTLLIELVLPWLNYEFEFTETKIWLTMVIYILIERSGATNIQLQSINNNIYWHFANGISGVFMLMLIPFLFKWTGLIGIPLSFAIGYLLFYLPFSIYLLYKELNYFEPYNEFFYVIIPSIILGIFILW
tara:strand:- start:371 stop:1792 length:1422 start_codon:yes stop_codon:yes gene_type:complete